MSAPAASAPKAWKYVLGAVLAFIILVPLWALFVGRIVEPESLLNGDLTMSKALLWFVSIPLLLVLAFFGWRWQAADEQARANRIQAAAAAKAVATEQSAQASEQARREYVLEVMGLGVTLDKFRQGALWNELKKGGANASVREQDPNKYPWSASEKEGMEGGRSGDTLENGAKSLPLYFGTPSFYACSSDTDPERPSSPVDPVGGLIGGATSSGMGMTLFIIADWEEAERPDRLLEKVFAFFDEHPDIPYVVLAASDGMYFRNMYRPKGTEPLIKDGHYVPEMPDASALFVLARRERVEVVRPFVFADFDESPAQISMEELNSQGFGRRLFLAYNALEKSVPHHKDSLGRNPIVPEWLAATKTFAQREDIYPKTVSLLHRSRKGPSTDFKPTPWFPLPFNTDQLTMLDKLPTLGYLHRPVFVKTVDEHGKPLERRAERAAALAAGWQQALLTLPEAERKTAPARVITAVGKTGPQATEQTIALHSMLGGWTEQGGPQLDINKTSQWINTDARLGNTGAATWFMQMAIGVMGSYREGGASAAINLRDPAEASIIFITPPPEDKRKSQQHPRGGDVFRHYGTPAIDPANYQN